MLGSYRPPPTQCIADGASFLNLNNIHFGMPFTKLRMTSSEMACRISTKLVMDVSVGAMVAMMDVIDSDWCKCADERNLNDHDNRSTDVYYIETYLTNASARHQIFFCTTIQAHFMQTHDLSLDAGVQHHQHDWRP